MTYRRPGVTVTQVFVGLAPALAAFALPGVAIGPAYQLVNDDSLGGYAGSATDYAYASKLGGAIVDLEELADDEVFPVTKKPLEVVLEDVYVEILDEQTETGYCSGTAFADDTASIFVDVEEGDELVIIETTGVEVVTAKADGITDDATPNRLTAGTTGDFDNVKVGDSVVVTAGTNTTPGTYVVLALLGSDTLLLDGNVNDGVGASIDVAYSITGSRGDKNAGTYKIAEVTDENNLVLESPLVEAEKLVNYRIQRAVPSFVLERGTDYTADETNVSLVDGIVDEEGFEVLEASVLASYRALRIDLASEVKEYEDVNAIESVFGIGQITPQNPLAYALSLMAQNTVTSVYGLGLDGNYATDETLAFTGAADVLKLTEMYALAPLSHLPTVHTLFKNHVEQLSQPGKKLERIAIINSSLVDTLVLQDETSLEVALLGAREIIAIQVAGSCSGLAGELDKLTKSGAFANSQPGDKVTITSGTNVTTGTYTIASVDPSGDYVILDSDFSTLGSAATDIQFYSVRPDGMESDGKTFYDRNGSFVADGISAGHYLTILTGSYAGRWKIGSVSNDKQLVLETALSGVTAVFGGFDYQIDRDLSKSEQAENIKGYGEAFGSRRVVHTWPDILQAPVGQVVEDLPGYYAGPVVAALVQGLPTQQGFTNLSVSGFLGLQHSTGYFTPEQLNTIADGGNFILAQDGPNQPLYCRHQLTTDRSAIKFQELSVTKNVDYIAKFLRTTFASFIGQYNIVDTTFDELSATAQGAINFLKSNPLPKIGSVIRGGSLTQLAESEDQIDTIIMRFSFLIPIPLNYIDITIEV